MANRIEAVMSGVGSVREVVDSTIQGKMAETWGPMLEAIAVNASKLIAESAYTKRAVLAVFCALLNKDFADSGKLFSIDENGEITYQYFATGKHRDLILALMDNS